MGLTVTLYGLLLLVGVGLRWQRSRLEAVTSQSVTSQPAASQSATLQATTSQPVTAQPKPAPSEVSTSNSVTSGSVAPDAVAPDAVTPDRGPATSVLDRDPAPSTADPFPPLAPTPRLTTFLEGLNLRAMHIVLGVLLVVLVLILLAIGIVGTLGHFGNLGHSAHLPMGLTVVALTLASAWSARRIHPDRPRSRQLHLSLNAALGVALALVSWTGWVVVQKYLP